MLVHQNMFLCPMNLLHLMESDDITMILTMIYHGAESYCIFM